MIKGALDKIIQEDLAEIWALLDGDEKRRIIDNFQIINFKKNQGLISLSCPLQQ